MVNLSQCGLSISLLQPLLDSLPLLNRLYLSSAVADDPPDLVPTSARTSPYLLEALFLSGAELITDAHLLPSLALCSFLNTVSLASCSRLGDETVLCLAEHCPLVQTLDLSETPVTVCLHLRIAL